MTSFDQAITAHLMSPSTRFVHFDGSPTVTVLDFWRWSNSDLLSNTTRGHLAEFLVAHAVGATARPREEWADWDVTTPSGIRVEVKSAAYAQSWPQARPSAIRYGIARASGWDYQTNAYDPERKRRAHVYVFCLLGDPDNPRPDPTNLAEWRFFVLPTGVLDDRLGDQKGAALSTLKRLGARAVTIGALREAIEAAAGRPVGTAPTAESDNKQLPSGASSSPFFARAPITENALAFAIHDAFPVTSGHTLVVPRRVVPTWFDATSEEQRAIFELVDEVKARLDRRVPKPAGYNVGFNAGTAAGQTVMHLHVHVIPRYDGDVADPRGGVRHVIPGRGNYLLTNEGD